MSLICGWLFIGRDTVKSSSGRQLVVNIYWITALTVDVSGVVTKRPPKFSCDGFIAGSSDNCGVGRGGCSRIWKTEKATITSLCDVRWPNLDYKQRYNAGVYVT